MRTQFSLSPHFYLLYLLLNYCDENDATHATWSSASLTQFDTWHITKRHRRSCWSNEKAVTCKHEGERTSLWTSAWSAKLKPVLFRATNSLLSTEESILRCELFPSMANIVIKWVKLKGQEIELAYHFCRAMLCKRGLSRHAVSVCLSRSWIMSKRINISSNFFHRRVDPSF